MEKTAYVVGSNVKTSLSPTIFKYWFNKYGVEGKYFYKEIKKEKFDEEIKKTLKEKNLCGLNITTPFKEKIIPHLTKTDNHATSIGAVNCVTIKDGAYEGTNTDWVGFQNSLEQFLKENQNKITTKKDIAIVLGFGGSAKAIIYSLIFCGYKNIKVFNRSYEKIKNIKKIFAFKLNDLSEHIHTADLIINTIPKNTNIQPHEFDMLDASHKFGKLKAIGYDVVYNQETHFLKNFMPFYQICGTLMLVHQAAPCFNAWFGVSPTIDREIITILNNKTKNKK